MANKNEYKVVVDTFPRTINGTNGCHQFVFGYYSTKKKAVETADEINRVDPTSKATVEKCRAQ